MNVLKHAELTEKILGAFYQVYGVLGYGFSEKVYENALAIELRSLGFQVQQQSPIKVHYRNAVVGDYVADIVVQDLVILEIRATASLLDEHEAQLLNYLKATTYEVGLLLNFGPKPDIRRKVYDNPRKGALTWTRRIRTRTNADNTEKKGDGATD